MSTTYDIGKVACTPKGAHIQANTYEKLDIVTYGGETYMAVQNVPANITIDNTTYWLKLVVKGAKGDTGDAAGFGTPTITASGLPAGSAPTATITASGLDTAKIFAFALGIPKGDTGATGKGITSIAKTSTAGLVDTYTITYTDSTTSTFTVTNGTSELESTTGQSTVKGMTQKAISDELSALNEDIDNLTQVNVTWINNKRLNNLGEVVDTNGWIVTDFINFRDDVIFQFAYELYISSDYSAFCIYDENQSMIQRYTVGTTSFASVKGVTSLTSKTAKYIRFCSYDTTKTHTISISDLNNFKIKDNAVTTSTISDASVTPQKCSFMKHDPTSNYIDTSKIIDGYYIQANGVPKASSGFGCTDYVEIESGALYYAYHLLGGYCAFYNASKEYVIGYGYGEITFPITVPSGCKYARFSTNTGWWADVSQIWLYTENEKPKAYTLGIYGIDIIKTDTNPCNYNGDEIAVFKKGLCIGDSLTEGVFNYVEGSTTYYMTDSTKSYPAKLKILTGLDIVNKGHGGLTSAEWYAQEQNTDLSGFDFCIIQLGVNDAFRYSGWTQTSVTAFTNIINKMKTENNNIKIYVATIMPATSYSGETINEISQGIRDLVDSLDDDNVILLDMALYAHTNDSPAYNAGHLSELGYYILAKDYKAYISYIISKNLMKYQQVQFIGTNHIYS